MDHPQVQVDHERMFVAFYGSKKLELFATSLLDAKTKAITELKPPKSKRHMVTVMPTTEYVRESYRYD